MSLPGGLTATTIEDFVLEEKTTTTEFQESDGTLQSRDIKTVVASQICVAPSAFAEQNGLVITSLTCVTSSGVTLDALGGSSFKVVEDRLQKDDQRVGFYRRVCRLTRQSLWADIAVW